MRYWGIDLTEGTTPRHVRAYYLMALVGIMFFTFIAGAQAVLVETVLGIAEGDQGSVSGQLGVAGELGIVLTIGFWGAMSDRVGRRPVVVLGGVILGVALLLTPFADSKALLLLLRLVGGLGTAAISAMISTIVADYVRNKTLGRANGYIGIANGLGAMVTVFALLQLPDAFESAGLSTISAIRVSYLIVGGTALLVTGWLAIALRGGAAVVLSERVPLPRLVREGVREGRRPGVLVAYAASFVARADLAIVGTYITLWAIDAGKAQGLSSTEALAKAGEVIGAAYGAAFLTAPLVGIACDRMRRVDAVLLALVISVAGYGATALIDDPLSGAAVPVAALIGAGQVFGVIASGVLIAEQAPQQVRGSVIGVFGLAGAAGILVAFLVGGQLYDHWRHAAPFLLFAGFGLVAAVITLVLRSRVEDRRGQQPETEALVGAGPA